jgi:hypothetical protein
MSEKVREKRREREIDRGKDYIEKPFIVCKSFGILNLSLEGEMKYFLMHFLMDRDTESSPLMIFLFQTRIDASSKI